MASVTATSPMRLIALFKRDVWALSAGPRRRPSGCAPWWRNAGGRGTIRPDAGPANHRAGRLDQASSAGRITI
jgi:hypothetical protein